MKAAYNFLDQVYRSGHAFSLVKNTNDGEGTVEVGAYSQIVAECHYPTQYLPHSFFFLNKFDVKEVISGTPTKALP